MYRIIFSSLSRLSVIFISFLPIVVYADWEARQRAAIDREEAGVDNGYYGQYDPYYDPFYGNYSYNYPSYSPYPTYPSYMNPNYTPYYHPGMYNPNTNFVNSPSSLNYPTGYPMYSENYIY